MTAQIPVVGGSISYTSPSYSYGQTTQAINGGYTFDLPLATVAAFTNSALTFSAQNTANSQSFMSGVIANQQAALTNVNNQSFQFQDKSLLALQNMYTQNIGVKRLEIKKKYSTANLLKPGSGCFITTAVTKAAGEPDDGPTLQFFRRFRDEVLSLTEEGEAMIKEYYAIAPTIVAAIDALQTSGSIYNYLLHNFIGQIGQQISVGNNEAAIGTYVAMVCKAHELAGCPDLPSLHEENATDYKQVFHPLGD